MKVTSLLHDSRAISASWKIQGPQAGNRSVGGPAEPEKQQQQQKEACSWLCRPKCIYEVRHLSSAWILSRVNSLHPHTHSRRLGYFSYVINGGKNELKKCSISFMAGHPLRRKVENAGPHTQQLVLFTDWEPLEVICIHMETSLRLDFWVPCSSPSPQIQLKVRLTKGVMFWKLMTMEITHEN